MENSKPENPALTEDQVFWLSANMDGKWPIIKDSLRFDKESKKLYCKYQLGFFDTLKMKQPQEELVKDEHLAKAKAELAKVSKEQLEAAIANAKYGKAVAHFIPNASFDEKGIFVQPSSFGYKKYLTQGELDIFKKRYEEVMNIR
ncbi:MAG: hypothetical protein WCJ58_08365 [bacterium]